MIYRVRADHAQQFPHVEALLNTGGHRWYLDEDGKVDMLYTYEGYHNGPKCQRCGYSFCEHCVEGRITELEPCDIDDSAPADREPIRTKKEAKLMILQYLYSMLEQGRVGGYVESLAGGEHTERRRLNLAVRELREELGRRIDRQTGKN